MVEVVSTWVGYAVAISLEHPHDHVERVVLVEFLSREGERRFSVKAQSLLSELIE